MNPIAHLRHNLVAYLALFVALGTGTAYAANQITSQDIARNAVKAKHIKDGQVRGAELAANAVNAAKVADGSLGGGDVADNGLTGADIDESTLQLKLPAPVQIPEPKEPDLSGFPEVVARGYLSGPGELGNVTRCKSVGADVPGVGPTDTVVITPGTLTAEVSYTADAGTDHVAYQACYTGTPTIFIGADVQYMVLRAQ